MFDRSWFEFYVSKCHLRRNCDGLRFRILDLQALAFLYYYPNDRFIFTDKEVVNLFKSALGRNQAICNCWAISKPQITNIDNVENSFCSDNDVYDFTSLRENEMMIYSGMTMEQLQNYAYCVSPECEREDFVSESDEN
ncbi:hypothetical protein CAEBREN_20833 [Caenorhabditis brenneri]|uniref:Uncharacterized protein n=1 Tax=Caenorhabditis brenneri TaxID=135651 RepID=G0M807_CAEBE|nr:hypothetical protein CAEBREN_20833 [Caenorhabditis brenneri]